MSGVVLIVNVLSIVQDLLVRPIVTVHQGNVVAEINVHCIVLENIVTLILTVHLVNIVADKHALFLQNALNVPLTVSAQKGSIVVLIINVTVIVFTNIV